MKICLAFLFCFTFLQVGAAQTTFKFDVFLSVQSDDSKVRSTVESYLRRELRSLNDVRVVDRDVRFELLVLVIPTRTLSGRPLGYTIAAVVNKMQSCKFGQTILSCPVYQNLTLYSGGDDDLRENCEDIVNTFDTRNLQPVRDLFESLERK